MQALRGAVGTVCKTLEHMESISGDVSGLTADSSTQRNLRTLIEALGRLIEE
jgi:hypothetical protein